MAILTILTAIITAIGTIVGTIAETGKVVLDAILQFFQAVFSLLQSFMQSAPTPMRILFFLFFIVALGNVFSNFYFATRYACDGNGVVYETDNIATAMSLMLKTQFQDMTTGERNAFITENFEVSNQKPSPTTIKCSGTLPRLYFYSVNVLDYKTWLLLLVLIMGGPIIIGYYSKMGALR